MVWSIYRRFSESTNFCSKERLLRPVAMMLGYVKNPQPVLFHSHSGKSKSSWSHTILRSTVTGHCSRSRETSSRDTDGCGKSPISTIVTSWKPLSRIRGSGIKACTLRSSLPCRTRTTAASGRRPVTPRTSGTVSKSITPSEWRCTGAFQGTSSMTSNAMPGHPPAVASLSVVNTQSTLTRRKINLNTASQLLSQPPNNTHEEYPAAQQTASEELLVSARLLYPIPTTLGQMTAAPRSLIRWHHSHAHCNISNSHSEHPIEPPTQSDSPFTRLAASTGAMTPTVVPRTLTYCRDRMSSAQRGPITVSRPLICLTTFSAFYSVNLAIHMYMYIKQYACTLHIIYFWFFFFLLDNSCFFYFEGFFLPCIENESCKAF